MPQIEAPDQPVLCVESHVSTINVTSFLRDGPFGEVREYFLCKIRT